MAHLTISQPDGAGSFPQDTSAAGLWIDTEIEIALTESATYKHFLLDRVDGSSLSFSADTPFSTAQIATLTPDAIGSYRGLSVAVDGNGVQTTFPWILRVQCDSAGGLVGDGIVAPSRGEIPSEAPETDGRGAATLFDRAIAKFRGLPTIDLTETNLIRSAQETDLTLMPGDYDLSGIGTRCVSFNVKSANAAGKSGSWVTKCRDFGIVVDGWQYFATPGNPDTNPSVVQSCKDVFVIQRLGATCGYWEMESLGAGDFYYSLTGSGSSFNVRGGAGNFFTVTSAGAVTLSPKAADLRLTAASAYKLKIDEAGTEVCWFSDESGVSTIEGQSTTCFKAVTGANVRLQGNAVEIWDNVGPTKLATVDSAGGATTITEHQGIWINLGAIIIERPSTYRGFETPLVYHDLANGGARAFQSDSKGFAIGGATSVGQDGALKIPVLAGDPSGNPPAGFIYLYGKGTGVYSKNSSGTVVAL